MSSNRSVRSGRPREARRRTAGRLAPLAFVALAAGACSSDGGSTGAEASDSPTDAAMPSASPDPTEASARYRLTFEATWSPETHPEGFPGNPHFSGLVGAVHGEQVRFWEPGQIATDGVRIVAETGDGATMLTEVEAAIASGYAVREIAGGGVPDAPGVRDVELEVTLDHPEITVITMLAPSPDWFAGVHGLSLLDADGFVEERTVDLVLYDAGTDDGPGYTSADAPTVPPGIIEPVTSAPGDSPFVNGRPVVGRFVIERLR